MTGQSLPWELAGAGSNIDDCISWFHRLTASTGFVGSRVRPGHASWPRIQGRALAALIIAGGLIGCSPILVRLSEVGPVATSFWRLLLALMPITVAFARRGGGRGTQMPATAREH